MADGLRDRDPALERELARTAARSVGREAAMESLRDFADHRAWPGGVRVDLDPERETGEEYADASSYLLWGLVDIYPAVVAGDPEACDKYERRMRSLSKLIEAWAELHTPSA